MPPVDDGRYQELLEIVADWDRDLTALRERVRKLLAAAGKEGCGPQASEVCLQFCLLVGLAHRGTTLAGALRMSGKAPQARPVAQRPALPMDGKSLAAGAGCEREPEEVKA